MQDYFLLQHKPVFPKMGMDVVTKYLHCSMPNGSWETCVNSTQHKFHSNCIFLLTKKKLVTTLKMLSALRRRSKGEIGFNRAIVSMKSLIAILSISIVLLFWGVDLSAQEKKEIKKWEITVYFGKGNTYELSPFKVPSYGLGVEYSLTPFIGVEGEINYLPGIAHVSYLPFSRSEIPIKRDEKYRLLWNINFLFHFNLTKIIKKPTIRLFLTGGIGYQYDLVEFIIVSFPTLEEYKRAYSQLFLQFPTLGGGIKVNVIGHLAVRLLYKIHRFWGEELQTSRLSLGLSYRF